MFNRKAPTLIYGSKGFAPKNNTFLEPFQDWKFPACGGLYEDLIRDTYINNKSLTSYPEFRNFPSLIDLQNNKKYLMNLLTEYSLYLDFPSMKERYNLPLALSDADVITKIAANNTKLNLEIYHLLKESIARKFFIETLGLELQKGKSLYNQISKNWSQNYYGFLGFALKWKDEDAAGIKNNFQNRQNIVMVDGQILVQAKFSDISYTINSDYFKKTKNIDNSNYLVPGQMGTLVDPLLGQVVAIHASNTFLPKILFAPTKDFGGLPGSKNFNKAKFTEALKTATKTNVANDPFFESRDQDSLFNKSFVSNILAIRNTNIERKKSSALISFVKRNKTSIILGGVFLGLVVGGLFSFGALSVVGLVAGTGIIATVASGLGTATMALGSGVAAHVGLASSAIGVKAAIGVVIPSVVASSVGSAIGPAIKKSSTAIIDSVLFKLKPNPKAIVEKNAKAADKSPASDHIEVSQSLFPAHQEKIEKPGVKRKAF